eukprot:COSAG05_NODE_467_length_9529_cov_27.560976_1_plen_57_part_10
MLQLYYRPVHYLDVLDNITCISETSTGNQQQREATNKAANSKIGSYSCSTERKAQQQ